MLKSKWSQQALPTSNQSHQPPSTGLTPLPFQIFTDDTPVPTEEHDKKQKKEIISQIPPVSVGQGKIS